MSKMKSEINYHEQSHYYSTKFMRNSKAVGVLWGVFTVCYTVLIIVVFLQVRHFLKIFWSRKAFFSKSLQNLITFDGNISFFTIDIRREGGGINKILTKHPVVDCVIGDAHSTLKGIQNWDMMEMGDL